MSDQRNKQVHKNAGVSPSAARGGLRLVGCADRSTPADAASTPAAQVKPGTPDSKQVRSPKSAFASMLSQVADQIDRDIQLIMKL